MYQVLLFKFGCHLCKGSIVSLFNYFYVVHIVAVWLPPCGYSTCVQHTLLPHGM